MSFSFTTLPGLALHAGNIHNNPAALGYKRGGRWRAISSREMLESIRRAGEHLIDLGLMPGDRVGIAAESSPFWLMADLAALGAGAVTVPLFPNAAREALRHQVRDSGMRFLFVGTPELREIFEPLCGPGVRILVLSPRLVQATSAGVWTRDPELPVPPGQWDMRAAAVQPGDTATLIYTSGSTGQPKGVELTHANIIHQIHAAEQRFPLDSKIDSALSFLPLSHVFERVVACFYLASGVSIHFAEDPRQVGDDLRALHPTLMTVVPRFLEKAHDSVMAHVRDAGGPWSSLGTAAMLRALTKPENAPSDWKDRLYDRLVYRPFRARMGGRLRMVICGSAPLDARLARFFINTGVQVYEGYGLTESAPVLAVNHPGHRKLGTVGQAFPGVELRIAPDGEVLARGPNVMRGYYGHAEATRETVDAEGWLHTGDLGRLDTEGFLTVTGRKKELFKTANGKYVAPVPIEQALTAHNLVASAVVIAEGRPFVTALIVPDFDALVDLRRALHADGEQETVGPFLRSPAVLERFGAIVESVNADLSSWERIRRFSLADAPPSIESGELTPTLKLRRHVMEEKHASKIQGMYRE